MFFCFKVCSIFLNFHFIETLKQYKWSNYLTFPVVDHGIIFEILRYNKIKILVFPRNWFSFFFQNFSKVFKKKQLIFVDFEIIFQFYFSKDSIYFWCLCQTSKNWSTVIFSWFWEKKVFFFFYLTFKKNVEVCKFENIVFYWIYKEKFKNFVFLKDFILFNFYYYVFTINIKYFFEIYK